MLMSGLAQFYDISCQRDVGRIVAAEFLLFGTNREIYYSATNWIKNGGVRGVGVSLFISGVISTRNLFTWLTFYFSKSKFNLPFVASLKND